MDKRLVWLLLAVFVIGIAVLIWKTQGKGKRKGVGVGSSGNIANCIYSGSSHSDDIPIMLDDDGRVYNLFMPTSGCHKAFATARGWDSERDPKYPYTDGAFFLLSDSMNTQIEADSSGHALYVNVEPLVIEVTKDKKARQLKWDDEFRLYTFEPHYNWKQKVMLDSYGVERQFVNSDYPSGVGPGPDDITFKFKDHSGWNDDVYYGDRFQLAVKEDGDAKVKSGPGSCSDLHFGTALTTNGCGEDVEFMLNPYPSS